MGDTLYEQYIKLTEENGTLNEELYHSQRKNK